MDPDRIGYSILIRPTLTVLLQNHIGPPTDELVPEQIRAVWLTDTLLDAVGTTLEALQDGSAETAGGYVPPALFARNPGVAEPAPHTY